jgi:enediyne biosynthesis protein E4
MNKLGTSASTAVISLALYALYSLHPLRMKPQPTGAVQTKSAGRDPGAEPSKETHHSSAGIQFREITKQAGIAGITICGGCEKQSVIEVNCGGVCWFDYNNDGFLDLFITSGATVDELRAIRKGQPAGQRNYLYRNNGDGTFADVTEIAGMTSLGWASGCAAADYDNDGNVDLFVSNVGESFLYRNLGDGTFSEVARKAGVSGGVEWHTGAAFGDFDGDGRLDLYVAAYVDLQAVLDDQKQCTWKGLSTYCGPRGMKGAPDKLYRNNGDGTFTDVTLQAGVQDRDLLYGFTVSFEDFDNDGKADIIVANDLGRNYVYHNLGKGKFEEVGMLWGMAYPIEGNPQANMGIALGDYDRDGMMDVFVTTFSDDHYTLYHNTPRQMFMDVSNEANVAAVTFPFLGWGTFFADLDNDSWLELFAVNGHIYSVIDQVPNSRQTFAQRPLLFRQNKPGIFTEVELRTGLEPLKNYSSRGAAYADFDNDGDLDIIYTNLGAAPTLLENITRSTNNWLTVQTKGTRSNRDGIGARVTLKTGDTTQIATVRSGESYLSGNDSRIHFGLGSHKIADEIEVRWPSGRVERVTNAKVNRIVTIREGEGIVSATDDEKGK